MSTGPVGAGRDPDTTPTHPKSWRSRRGGGPTPRYSHRHKDKAIDDTEVADRVTDRVSTTIRLGPSYFLPLLTSFSLTVLAPTRHPRSPSVFPDSSLSSCVRAVPTRLLCSSSTPGASTTIWSRPSDSELESDSWSVCRPGVSSPSFRALPTDVSLDGSVPPSFLCRPCTLSWDSPAHRSVSTESLSREGVLTESRGTVQFRPTSVFSSFRTSTPSGRPGPSALPSESDTVVTDATNFPYLRPGPLKCLTVQERGERRGHRSRQFARITVMDEVSSGTLG